MDLLFSRYASPYLLLDETIKTGRFLEFVFELLKIHNEENEDKMIWELYLHKIFDKSFADFMNEIKKTKATTDTADFETTVTTINESRSILDSFSLKE